MGVQLAQPDRPVVCVVGEGSAQYAITALWSAAAYSVPLTVLVLRNAEYAILKWFADVESVSGAPGLDLPSLSCLGVAEGYGVPASRGDGAGRDELAEALREGDRGAGEPRLARGADRARDVARPQRRTCTARAGLGVSRPGWVAREPPSRCARTSSGLSGRTRSSPAPPTSSATRPTPARTG